MSMLHAVIMAGGSGTRFWPASRSSFPKQLLAIATGRPLIEETVDRISGMVPPERTLIVTNATYAGMTAELLSEIPEENVIGEPVGRDTSACIGLAALVLRSRDPEAVMAVMPSDHIISPKERFCSSLKAAQGLIAGMKDALITFGIQPSFPATGYGYIKRGPALSGVEAGSFYEVESFQEKPSSDVAKAFVEEGGYYWNAGIFMWRADTILEMIARYLPGLHRDLMRMEPVLDSGEFAQTLERVYPGLEKISIDFGVMEKADKRVVAEVAFEWDDIGSWSALERFIPADDKGNHAKGDLVALDSGNNIVSSKGGMVGLVGVEGLIVVHTPDATLVCRKEDAEKVKGLVGMLKDEYK